MTVRAFGSVGLLVGERLPARKPWAFPSTLDGKRPVSEVNAGLLYHRLWLGGDPSEAEIALRTGHLDAVAGACRSVPAGMLDALHDRRHRAARAFADRPGWACRAVRLTPQWRIVVGHGEDSVHESSLTLSPTYGVPILPGSALKGIAAAAARDGDTPDLTRIFGSPRPQDSGDARQGSVTIFDALPVDAPTVMVDVLTPHVKPYYDQAENPGGPTVPPAEYHNPVPVRFLAVQDTAFRALLAGPATDVAVVAQLLTRGRRRVRVGRQDLGRLRLLPGNHRGRRVAVALMHVLPVGLSLLNVLKNRLPAASNALDPQRLAQDAQGYRLAAVLARATTYPDHELRLDGLLAEPAREALVHPAREHLCAEWASVRLVAQGQPAPPGVVAYVLIATDTDDGLRAATLVAARYANGKLLRYLDDPGTGPLAIEPDTVSIYRIPGLDLAAGVPGRTAWETLGRLGHAIARTAADAIADRWDVVLHLSGGYKALMPYLLVLAEGINSVISYRAADMPPQRRPTLRAVATHESNDRALVDLPVRCLSEDLYIAARNLKAALGPSNSVTGTAWDVLVGLALESKGQRRNLTPLGTILVNVL